MHTDFVQAGPVRLQYFEHGTGPELLVLVHGYRSSGRIWRLMQEALDTSRFRAVALSNRGAGDSDRTAAEADYTVESFSQDLFAVTQALGWRDFTLVGHSMGGATAAQFALDHGDLVKALVLLAPAPLSGQGLPENWEQQIRAQFATGAPPEELGLRAPDAPEEFLQALQADVARNPLERTLGGRRSMGGLKLRQRLHELSMPVLVVGGDQDTAVGVHNMLAEYLALPEHQRFLHIFHDVGHSPNVEVVSQFTGVLVRFVSQTVPHYLENLAFPPESERYMVRHMNEQYAASTLLYARVYGQLREATDATLVRLNKAGMELEATVPEGTRRLRIPFDHRLQDEGDAQQTLVEMSFKARDLLAQRA